MNVLVDGAFFDQEHDLPLNVALSEGKPSAAAAGMQPALCLRFHQRYRWHCHKVHLTSLSITHYQNLPLFSRCKFQCP